MAAVELLRRLFGSPIPWMVALNVTGLSVVAPVLPAYAAHFGVGFAAVSTVVTAFALARMTFRVASGTLADRHGSRAVCTGGGAVQAGGALLAAVAPSFGVLIGARAIQGLGSALFGTAVNRYLLVTTPRADLGRAIAGFQVGILAGAALGPVVGGVVADRFGIFAPFVVQAMIAGLLALVSNGYIRDAPGIAGRAAPAQPIRALLGIRGFKVVMLLGFGFFFVRAGALNVLVPAFADETLSMSASEIGVIIAVVSVVSFMVMPVAGHLADSVGRIPVALAGAFGTAGFISMFGLVDTSTGLAVIAAVMGIGFGSAAVAMPTMIGDIAPPGIEGRASGVYRMANDMGWVIGPLVLGFLADGSRYELAFLIAGLPIFLGGLVLALTQALRPDAVPASREEAR
jgi:MFS family permease